MFERFTGPLLRWLRVPPEPQPPAGSPGSLQVFRASENFHRYLITLWVGKQIGPLIAIAFVLTTGLPFNLIPDWLPRETAEALRQTPIGFLSNVLTAPVIRRLLLIAEVTGIALLFAQMPFTFLLVRLNYELRWYMVTDRSLRIREGVGRINEMTLTFTNVQQVSIQQGPLQRMLGIADIKVRTAGGGGTAEADASTLDSSTHSVHIAWLRGVDHAHELRDTILARVRGEAEQSHAPETTSGPQAAEEAARELLEEARALRRALVR